MWSFGKDSFFTAWLLNIFFRRLKTCKRGSLKVVVSRGMWGSQSEAYECGKCVPFEGWCTVHACNGATSVSAVPAVVWHWGSAQWNGNTCTTNCLSLAGWQTESSGIITGQEPRVSSLSSSHTELIANSQKTTSISQVKVERICRRTREPRSRFSKSLASWAWINLHGGLCTTQAKGWRKGPVTSGSRCQSFPCQSLEIYFIAHFRW